MSIGQKIRSIREHRGYSQRQAAEGISLNLVKSRTLEEQLETVNDKPDGASTADAFGQALA